MAHDSTSLSYLIAAEFPCGYNKQRDHMAPALNVLIKEGLESTSAPRHISIPRSSTGTHYPKMVERNENGKKSSLMPRMCEYQKSV